MRAIRFKEYGDPEKVLSLENIPEPEITPGQILVRLKARSINPSDVFTIRGEYGVKPKLPASPGNEGAGVIEKVGSAVTNFKPGDRVTLYLGASGSRGTWLEYIAVDPENVMKTPDGLSDEQAATSWVNYLTAWVLSFEELDLKRGDSVLVTALASHLGMAMLQLAKIVGFEVIGTVRREEQKQELLDMGAKAVIATDTENLSRKIFRISGGKGIASAIDCVGGKVGTEVLKCLSPRGVSIVYGYMSEEPIQIDGRIIFSEAQVRGFWLARWLNRASAEHQKAIMERIVKHFVSGEFNSVIDSRFDLADYAAMIKKATSPGRKGKIVITG